MKGTYRKVTATLLAFIASLTAQQVVAGIPVIDAANLASNVIQNIQLKKIQKTLNTDRPGTINYYTKNIDDNSTKISTSTTNIDESTVSIDKSTTSIDYSTKNIDNSTRNIDKTTVDINTNLEFNTQINQEFKWVIVNGKDEIIPVPPALISMLNAILGGRDSAAYSARYHAASDYYSQHDGHEVVSGDDPDFEGSRSRKAANDALVEALSREQARLVEDGQRFGELAAMAGVEGHANQLQVANAIAGSQVDQLMKMRSMMLASESARAAESLAASDKEARAIATRKHLRDGLREALISSELPALAP